MWKDDPAADNYGKEAAAMESVREDLPKMYTEGVEGETLEEQLSLLRDTIRAENGVGYTAVMQLVEIVAALVKKESQRLHKRADE